MEYGYSTQIEADDERQEEWRRQRATRGFDDTETWNMEHVFAKFMAPRLRVFAEKTICHPPEITMDEWRRVVLNIAIGLEELEKDDPDYKLIDKAWTLLYDWHNDLWW